MNTLRILALAFPLSLAAQQPALDTVRAGRFDQGTMWTFEDPPDRYFSETSGFLADSAWFARARLAALRLRGCSAAFVSPHGLVVTNHHCARDGIVVVSRPGKTLLDSGFVAHSLDDERRMPGMYLDQLLAVQDVSDRILPLLDRAPNDSIRVQWRREATSAIQDTLKTRYASPGDSIWVQFVALYNGGRYSAYVFRRFTDIRLVAAPELQLGFFGGDPDNFTYPRYDLDVSVLRVYGRDGRPYETPNWFVWGKDGVQPGDVVFVIGNPGSTSRLKAVSQLEYERDVSLAAQVRFLSSRLEALRSFSEEHRAAGDSLDVRNWMFGISNSLKSAQGRLAALFDPMVMARRRDAERVLAESLAVRRDLKERYGRLLTGMADVQRHKATLAAPYRAFATLGRRHLWRQLRVARGDEGPAARGLELRPQRGRAGARLSLSSRARSQCDGGRSRDPGGAGARVRRSAHRAGTPHRAADGERQRGGGAIGGRPANRPSTAGSPGL